MPATGSLVCVVAVLAVFGCTSESQPPAHAPEPAADAHLPSTRVDGKKLFRADQETVERILAVARLVPDKGSRTDAGKPKARRPGDYTEIFRGSSGALVSVLFIKGKAEVIDIGGAGPMQVQAKALEWLGLGPSTKLLGETLLVRPSEDDPGILSVELSGAEGRIRASTDSAARRFNAKADSEQRQFEQDPSPDHDKRLARCIRDHGKSPGAGTARDIRDWCELDIVKEVAAETELRALGR